MNKKKGQAAMEFLMTYGWAILAAIIVIAVLAIYFRPGKIAPSVAAVEAPFSVLGWAIVADGTWDVQLEMKNAGAETLTVTSVALTNGCATTAITPSPAAVLAGAKISDGTDTILEFVCDETLVAGGTFSSDLAITYTRPGSTIVFTATGTVSGSID